MPLELQRLKIHLENMKVVLEEAVKKNSSFLDQTKISKQIAEAERLIEERKEYLRKQNME